MNAWLALLGGYLAMVAFALAMPPHQRTYFGRPRSARWGRMARCVGAGLIGACYGLAASAQGWQVGAVLATAGLAIAGFVLTQFLAWAPRRLWVPAAGLALGAIAMLWS